MDADESDKDISISENDSDDEEEENSSGGDSEEESDENEDALSDEEDTDSEAASDDDNDDRTEAASTVAGDEAEAAGSESDDEEILEEEGQSKLEDPDMSCPICLNEFDGQDLGSPENCNHTFCLECIVEWSKNVNTCPIDRIEFHLIYVKHEINGKVMKKIKVQVKKEVEDYVEEVTLCEVCRLGDREDRLLLCDSCDSGYHCECLDPPLDAIPIEEWFCPPCARVISRRAGNSHSSHSRLIARTSASEIVRTRIQNHRTANSEDSSSESAAQQPRNVRPANKTPVRRKTTRRKTRRKATRKSSKSKTTKARTKATSAGKSKTKNGTTKSPTKRRRRKTRRRKSRKTKKKSKRSWLASMKLVAPSVKKRIADHLGLCKPPPGHTMPYVKKSSGWRAANVEQLPSVDMFGCREKLFDFSESYSDENLDDPRPSTSKPKKKTSSLRKTIAVASVAGLSLLDNILENQNALLQSSKDITIGKDGSLIVKEISLSLKAKSEIKSVKSEPKNEVPVSEQQEVTASLSQHVKKEKYFASDDKETDNYTVVSSPIVKKEKRSPSPDPLCSKRTKLDEMALASLSSVSSIQVQKERGRSRPHVRFDSTETHFTIEKRVKSNTGEQTLETALLSPLQTMTNSSLSGTEKKDFPSLTSSVFVKKEKEDNLSLESLVDVADFEFEAPFEGSSFNIYNGRHQKDSEMYRVEGYEDSVLSNQFLKGSASGPLSVLNGTQKRNRVMNNFDIGTNKLCSPYDSANDRSPKESPSYGDYGQKKSSKSIIVGRDGSLSVKKNSLPRKTQDEIKNVNSEIKNEISLLEHHTKLDEMSSLYSIQIKTERDCPQPCVRFDNSKTALTIEKHVNSNTSEQAAETVLPSPLQDYLPSSSFSRTEKKDFCHLRPSVSIKKEKKDDMPFDSPVNLKNFELEPPFQGSPSFDIDNERYQNDSKVCQDEGYEEGIFCNEFLKDSPSSVSSVLNGTQTQNRAMNDFDISTNKFSIPCNSNFDSSPEGKPSFENHSQRRCSKSICTKTEESPLSSYDIAENDRKRHLSFLTKSMQRPFKIPKLAKRTGGNLASSASLPSPETSSKQIDTKVLVISEDAIDHCTPVKPMLTKEDLQDDVKPQSAHRKHRSHTNSVNKTVDVDMHADLNKNDQNSITTPDENSLLGASRQKEMSKSRTNSSKGNLNFKYSLLPAPSPSNSKNSHEANNKNISVSDSRNSPKLTSNISSTGLHLDRKPHNSFADMSSKVDEVKNCEQKNISDRVDVEHKRTLRTEKSPTPKNTELNKAVEKVPSKQKLKELIIDEIKKHLKDFYVTDLITKEEYKEIMRRSVPKVFQNCGNSIDSQKIRKLVVSYVHLVGNTKSGCS